MEEAHLEEQYLKNAEKDKHMGILAQQREMERKRAIEAEKNRFGGVGVGFFNNFGKSCR